MCPYTDGAKGNPEDTSYYDEEFGISILTPILESVPLIRKPEFAKVCGHKLPDYDIEGLISNARSGHRGSRFVLGCKYYNGTDVKQSYGEAMKWFIKASNKQDPKAAFYLGCMYLSGIGTEQSYENAANWFRKAVSFGDPDAMLSGAHVRDRRIFRSVLRRSVRMVFQSGGTEPSEGTVQSGKPVLLRKRCRTFRRNRLEIIH